MSLRIDSTEWLAGSVLIGETGLGVLGSAIPSTGDNGAGYCYNDLSLPADNTKEICGRITTPPATGTLTAYEDTSFLYTGPDGTHTFQYQLYVDGVATGSPTTVTLNVGVSSSVSFTLNSIADFTGYAVVSPVAVASMSSVSSFSGTGSVSPSVASTLASTSLFSGSAGVGSVATISVGGISTFSGLAYTTPLAGFSVPSLSAATLSASVPTGASASFSDTSVSAFSGSAIVSPIVSFALASTATFSNSNSYVVNPIRVAVVRNYKRIQEVLPY